MTVNNFFSFNTLVQLDHSCDYVPFVSTITNLIDIFEKCVLLNYKKSVEVQKNPYFKHLIDKKFFRCVLLIVPVIGNVAIFFIDKFKKEINQKAANFQAPHLPGVEDNGSTTNGSTTNGSTTSGSPTNAKGSATSGNNSVNHNQVIDKKIDYEKDKDTFLNYIKELNSQEHPGTGSYSFPFKFKDDFDVMLEMVKRSPSFYQFGGGDIKKNKEIILATVQKDGHLLKDIDTSALTEKELKEVVIAAVKSKGTALEFAKNFQNDEEVVHFALNTSPYLYGQDALKFVSPELQQKIEKKKKKQELQDSLSVISQESLKLKIDDPVFIEKIKEFMDDEDFVLFLVNKCGSYLKHASFELQKNEKIIFTAIKNDVYSLEYVVFTNFSAEHQRDIALIAIKKNSVAFHLIPQELKNDLEIIKKTVPTFGYCLKFITNQEALDDINIVSQAVEENGNALECASEKIKKNAGIVLKAVLKEGLALKFAYPELQNNIDIALAAVAQNGMALEFVSPGLQANKEVVYKALSNTISAEKFAKLPQATIDEMKKEILKPFWDW